MRHPSARVERFDVEHDWLSYTPQVPALLLEASDAGARWASPSRPPKCAPQAFEAGLESQGALVVTEAGLEAAALAAAEEARDSILGDDEARSKAADAAEDAVWAAISQNCRVFSRMSPQGKARVCRALFEMALRAHWPSLAERLLQLAKAVERRLWWFQHPVRQVADLEQR